MAKDKRKKKTAKDEKKSAENNERPKKSSNFGSFLKKRAPFYLAGVALLVVFVIPELTKGDLQTSLPELSVEEQKIADIVLNYDGPNQTGLTVMEAIEDKIEEEYPDEKIYDNKKTKVDLAVTSLEANEYNVILSFESYNGELNYDWNVNAESGDISSNSQDAKNIINLVDFYD